MSSFLRLFPLLGMAMFCGCAAGPGSGPNTSPSSGIPWTPPRARASLTASSASPTDTLAARHATDRARWTLADLIDVALDRNPLTRGAWEQARAAAARYAGERSAYLPAIDANANYLRQKSATGPGRAQSEVRSYGGTLDLSWLLFDFGGRESAVAVAHEALRAANWTHSAALQDVIYSVELAYFDYTTARALVAAGSSSLDEARQNLAGAEARHASGVATIADVLQARTALAAARLGLDEAEGQRSISRGALATALGLPANLTFEVAPDTLAPPVERTLEAVEAYLARARAERPDLAAAEALADQARAVARRTRAEGYPSLSAAGSLGRTYFDALDRDQPTYSATLRLNVPLFTGFGHQQDVRAADAEARAARARADRVAQGVGLDVWTSYHELKTATQRVATTNELLTSATESHDVAAGRYRAGVGDILDLLQAQTALENARALQVRSRADWYLAVARLARDTGTLTRTSPLPMAHDASPPEKDDQK